MPYIGARRPRGLLQCAESLEKKRGARSEQDRTVHRLRLLQRADVREKLCAGTPPGRLGWDRARDSIPGYARLRLRQTGPTPIGGDGSDLQECGIMSVRGFPTANRRIACVADVRPACSRLCDRECAGIVSERAGTYIDLSMQDACRSPRPRWARPAGGTCPPPRERKPAARTGNTYAPGWAYIAPIVHTEEQWRPFART